MAKRDSRSREDEETPRETPTRDDLETELVPPQTDPEVDGEAEPTEPGVDGEVESRDPEVDGEAEGAPSPTPLNPNLLQNYRLDCQPSGLSISVDNESGGPKCRDPESGEQVRFLFNVITTLTDEGALKLAQLVSYIHAAGVVTHTYDARSGAGYRVTQLGVTDARLLQYAAAFDLARPFLPEEVRAECAKKGISIENPDTAQGQAWYDPYENLSGAFEIESEKMYAPLSDCERNSFFRSLVSGASHFKGAAKGCGLDIAQLESTKEDNAFCLAVFPSHDEAAKETLEAKWMPLDWPWNLPLEDIKNYFGEVCQTNMC